MLRYLRMPFIVAAGAWLAPSVAGDAPFGTAFLYQGRLLLAGDAVSDDCDFQFRLFDDPLAGTQVGPTLVFDASGGGPGPLAVVDGLVTAQLDFGAGTFSGDLRFLEVAVRCPSGVGDFMLLDPRQPITPAPYAVNASGLFLPFAAATTASTGFQVANQNAVAPFAAIYGQMNFVGPSTAAGVRGDTANAVGVYGTTSQDGFGGLFESLGFGMSGPALVAKAGNLGDALRAEIGGGAQAQGRAASFEVFNTSHSANAVEVLSRGLGGATRIEVRNTASDASALFALSDGTGPVGEFVSGMPPAVVGSAFTSDAVIVGINHRAIDSAGQFTIVEATNAFPALAARHEGSGSAGAFQIENAVNGQSAVTVTTDGLGPALFAETTNPVNVSPVIDALKTGFGPAGRFQREGGGASAALEARSVAGRAAELLGGPNPPLPSQNAVLLVSRGATGDGAALNVVTDDPNGLSCAVDVFHDSEGAALRIDAISTRSQSPALLVDTLSEFGSAASFANTGATSSAVGVDIAMNSTEPALRVSQVAPSGSVALFDQNAPGVAGDAVTIDVNNARHPLFVRQTGSGEAAHFEVADPGNGNLGVFVKNNGTGIALQAMNTNAFFGALALAVLGKAAFNGQLDVIGGPVVIDGSLCATSACASVKSFRIDHPLDPENKYLFHSCVESDEMKNVYDGVAQLDAAGRATVALPAWFEALNGDFRYQLTPIGVPGPGLYIAREVADNRFVIAGGASGAKVSWQVTGVRRDPVARARRIEVEVDKPETARGTYLNAEAYGVTPEQAEQHRLRSRVAELLDQH